MKATPAAAVLQIRSLLLGEAHRPASARLGDVPAKMPYRALRLGGGGVSTLLNTISIRGGARGVLTTTPRTEDMSLSRMMVRCLGL